MKFNNVKTGDIVFVTEEVLISWGQSRRFFVPVKIDSETNSRLKIGEDVFNKKDGFSFGHSKKYSRIYLLGEITSFGQVVVDQSKEKKDFETKMKLIREVKEEFSRINDSRNSIDFYKFSFDELLKTLNFAKEIK